MQAPIQDLIEDRKGEVIHQNFTKGAYELALAKTKTILAQTKGMNKEQVAILLGRHEIYLETEKIQSALAIQAAEEWERIEANKDLFPNLRYVAVNDENTRESHRDLSGIVRPVDDVFWDTHYPPIDYRCRCSVRQEQGTVTVTPIPKKLPSVPVGLRHNTGKTQKTFDTSHPYFDEMQKKDLLSINEYASYPEDMHDKLHYSVDTAGYLVAEKNALKADLKMNRKIGTVLAKHGYRVLILRNENSQSPDVLLNTEYTDIKISAIPEAMREADNQDIDPVIIGLTNKDIDLNKITKQIEQGFEETDLDTIILVWKDNIAKIKRTDYGLEKILDILKNKFQ